jgi:hypothetical protein
MGAFVVLTAAISCAIFTVSINQKGYSKLIRPGRKETIKMRQHVCWERLMFQQTRIKCFVTLNYVTCDMHIDVTPRMRQKENDT